MQNKEKIINKIHFEDIKLYFINIQMWQGECLYLYIQKKINIYCIQTVFFSPKSKILFNVTESTQINHLYQQNSFMWAKSGRNSSLSQRLQVTTFYSIYRQHLYKRFQICCYKWLIWVDRQTDRPKKHFTMRYLVHFMGT